MPTIHRLLEHTPDEGLEKVRDESVTTFTTIGVVAALVLSMARFSEQVTQDMGFPDDWLDCSEVPCNRIHVCLSGGSFLLCAHAVLCSTLVVGWLSLTPVSATRDLYYTFPNVMRRPAQSMAIGTSCWAADNMWLVMVQHGTKDMQWVLIPMVFLFAHVVLLLFKMRAFA
eukprot:TRINITY_DN16968_c0_g1_i2.p1 TRINITY_DN16968_c0_g1~~TRINITY_DN16968_c0_g1_i2.p1  ORF type:complete len:187 (-),score=21.45 TRINITY_DN16968_c0_g1_i2:266-775(-)